MWRWDVPGAGWWMMGVGFLSWALMIVLVVWLVVRVTGHRPSSGGAESAEELLRRRFASGEIDAEEFERRMEVLRRR
jgi:putative membrane protein